MTVTTEIVERDRIKRAARLLPFRFELLIGRKKWGGIRYGETPEQAVSPKFLDDMRAETGKTVKVLCVWEADDYEVFYASN